MLKLKNMRKIGSKLSSTHKHEHKNHTNVYGSIINSQKQKQPKSPSTNR